MSELKIAEFRERAEQGLGFPDLDGIERRGRALHRRRVATAVGALALVVLAGGGLSRITADGTDASPLPAGRPSPTATAAERFAVHTTVDRGEEVLLPGPSTVTYDGIAVHFDVTGEDWEWWDSGMGLRRSAEQPDDYGAAVFFLRDASVRLQPCRDGLAQALGSDPDRLVANVAPLLDLAHATVVQGPRVVDVFGGSAVHLQLQTDGSCPEGGGLPVQLRGVSDGSSIDPGFGGTAVLDVWHVVVPGPEPASMLVASWDLDGTSQHRALQQALLDSLRIGRS